MMFAYHDPFHGKKWDMTMAVEAADYWWLLLDHNFVMRHLAPRLHPDLVRRLVKGKGKTNGEQRELRQTLTVFDVQAGETCGLLFSTMWAEPEGDGGPWYSLQGHWREKFVERHRLRKGDVIGMRWDDQLDCFLFRVLRRNHQYRKTRREEEGERRRNTASTSNPASPGGGEAGPGGQEGSDFSDNLWRGRRSFD